MHRRHVATVLALSMTVAVLGAACEEEDVVAETAAGPASSAEIIANITLTPADNRPFGLAEGNYRLEWQTECASVTITVLGDTGYTKKKTSGVPSFSTILTSVPAGRYEVSQTDAACPDWTISISKV